MLIFSAFAQRADVAGWIPRIEHVRSARCVPSFRSTARWSSNGVWGCDEPRYLQRRLVATIYHCFMSPRPSVIYTSSQQSRSPHRTRFSLQWGAHQNTSCLLWNSVGRFDKRGHHPYEYGKTILRLFWFVPPTDQIRPLSRPQNNISHLAAATLNNATLWSARTPTDSPFRKKNPRVTEWTSFATRITKTN